jgi:transcriptional regulator with XRE-family HTH domain
MSKPTTRGYSRYAREAVELLGHMIRNARIDRQMTVAELAERAGVSRGLVNRIENGDMGCSIGATFEMAAILGIRLFDAEPTTLTRRLGMARDRLTLLPKAVRQSPKAASLEELLGAAERVEKGIPLTPELDETLFHGSSLGGARPKAMKETLRELFGRLVFNILSGNADDHARNHAAFWDGRHLTLTPAYDICPQNRTGNEATQAMLITGDDRMNRLATCLVAAPNFLLDAKAAENLIADQIKRIQAAWPEVAQDANLTEIDRAILAGRLFFNPFVFEDAPPRLSASLAP